MEQWKISEKQARKTIDETVMKNVVWQLAAIQRSGYNEEGIKRQLEAIRDFISPKSEAEVRDAPETTGRKNIMEGLLQELRAQGAV